MSNKEGYHRRQLLHRVDMIESSLSFLCSYIIILCIGYYDPKKLKAKIENFLDDMKNVKIFFICFCPSFMYIVSERWNVNQQILKFLKTEQISNQTLSQLQNFSVVDFFLIQIWNSFQSKIHLRSILSQTLPNWNQWNGSTFKSWKFSSGSLLPIFCGSLSQLPMGVFSTKRQQD